MLDQLLSGGISGILKGAAELIDTFHTSDEEKHKMKMELLSHQLDVFKSAQSMAIGQMKINLKEAEHPSRFVSGWRPFVGWTCGAGLAYAVVVRPLLNWSTSLLATYTEVVIPVLPVPDLEVLMTTLMGMLGMAGYRTYEKLKGVARGK